MIVEFSQYQFLEQPPFFIGVADDATDWYSEQTRKYLTLQPNVEYALRTCRRGEKAIDLGANIGHFTLPLANQGVSVLAVEALPENFSVLCQSVARNRFTNIVPVHAAVHSAAGLLRMDGFGAWGQVATGPGGVLVPSVTVDELCSVYGFWDASFVKMDIEGSELAAFRGAEHFMDQSPGAVFLFEANEWSSADYGYPVSELLAFLDARGYSLFMFEGRSLTRRTPQSFQERFFADYLACRSASPPLVEGFAYRELSWEERIQTVLVHAGAPELQPRAYTLAMAAAMPDEIRLDPRVLGAMRRLEMELPDSARPVVAQISEAAKARGRKT